MLRIAVCDDSLEELENTCSFLNQYFAAHPETACSIKQYQSSYDLMDAIREQARFDLYFLDIIMPLRDGIEVGRLIRRYDQNACIVYLTSSPDFAVKSYRVQALDYLVKPFDAKELYAVVERAIEKLSPNRDAVFPVKCVDGIHVLHMGQVMYAEGRNRKYTYHLSDGSMVESVTRRESFEQVMEPLLHSRYFLKCSVSFVVNLNYVSIISREGFSMRDGATVPISRGNYMEMKKAFLNFLLERGR